MDAQSIGRRGADNHNHASGLGCWRLQLVYVGLITIHGADLYINGTIAFACPYSEYPYSTPLRELTAPTVMPPKCSHSNVREWEKIARLFYEGAVLVRGAAKNFVCYDIVGLAFPNAPVGPPDLYIYICIYIRIHLYYLFEYVRVLIHQ